MSPPTRAARRGSLSRTAIGRTALLTAFAILAFAGNSLLTRAALADGAIGPGTFTGLRLGSGAFVLALLAFRGAGLRPRGGDGAGTIALLGYAIAFTYAYVSLGAATGALILFATVQVTMVTIALARGEVPTTRERVGLVLALVGLGWLLLPQASAPSAWAAISMVLAGVAWGAYTVIGRASREPLGQTARYFIGAAPFGLGLALVAWLIGEPVGMAGVALAVASGAVTSGLGYAVWYAALPGLTSTVAGVAQLLVPAVAAAGAAIWLEEPITSTLVLASLLIFAGIGVSLSGRRAR